MADAKLQTRIRREQIAAAALQLVASEGVKRLSIAAVARRVGLVPSGIYRHFKSKDAMLDAVLDLLDAKLQANVEAAATKPPTRWGGCTTCSSATSALSAKDKHFPASFSPTRPWPRSPNARTRVRRIVGDYLAKWNAWSAKDSRQGHIDRQLRPHGSDDVPGNDRARGRGLAPDRWRFQSHAACRPGLEDVSAGIDRE